MKSSTFRSAIDPTIGEASAHPRPTTLRQLLNTEWHQTGQADLVNALRRHPVLLRDRSLLLNLAIEEYRSQCQVPSSIDLEEHCQRFREFGSSIHRSILRQLEAQCYIDAHPELLEALCSPTWPKSGQQFGNFQVLEELGFGATAHVYLCSQLDVGNRKVVVKATPFSSFEASILGRLNHPNIIPIYSTGVIEECNLHYLCMPYCGRSTLSDLLDAAFQDGFPRRESPIAAAATRWTSNEQWPAKKARGLLPAGLGLRTYVDGILALAIQIADALHHAHRHHILHGDLKPSNVLLTPDSQPLLLDFNLSQDFASSSAVCGGTLPYMPPEHLELVAGYMAPRETDALEPASDIYSLGALLYELLAGVTPVALPAHVDDSSAVAALLLDRIQHGAPSIRGCNPLVSRRLETIVLRCLAFDRSDRPSTMAEISHNLKGEMRSLAAVGRLARVRPLFISAAVGLPLVVLAGAATHVAVQPARYLSDYQQGMKLASAGELDEAIDYFNNAVDSNPSFAPAQFQLARTRLARGEIDLAIDEFGQLARTNNDAHSMAYVGYCFNLKSLPVAAIPWYERAIRSGHASAAIYNNLGASYLDAPPRIGLADRVRRADDCLHIALKLDSTSAIVQFNIVRVAIGRAQIDSSHDPFGVWPYANSLLAAEPDDPLVRFHVATWYATVVNYDTTHNQDEQPSNSSFSTAEQSARNAFAALLESMESFTENTDPSDTARSWQSRKSPVLSVGRYILEPVSLVDLQP
jgi:eukaryotic-like serine/threonine-protein kinase